MELEQALKLVRTAGYRVTKPKPKKQTRVGPTCVVQFADGSTYRMTTHCPGDVLAWDRGLKLCRMAWESRNKSNNVPSVVSAYFERDGEELGAM